MSSHLPLLSVLNNVEGRMVVILFFAYSSFSLQPLMERSKLGCMIFWDLGLIMMPLGYGAQQWLTVLMEHGNEDLCFRFLKLSIFVLC